MKHTLKSIFTKRDENGTNAPTGRINSYFFLLYIILLTNCTHRIADVTMISTRNHESKITYVELKKYKKGKDRALYSILFFGPLSAPDIEDAVDETVKQVEGGEFLKNAVVRERYNFFLLFTIRVFIVEGDVWGIGSGSVTTINQNANIEIEDNKKPIEIAPNKSKPERQIYKTISDLKMRLDADISSDVILVLNKGAEVELIEKTNSTWWKVKYANVIGYVSSKHLSK